MAKIHLCKVDVTDFSELSKIIIANKPDIIIHLAGETSHKKSFENPMYDVDVNLKSTLCILETIRTSKLNCKFILGSTFIVVGKPDTLPINETINCNPTTVYGTTRLASEHLCKIYQNVYDLDTLSFRITNAFGPREQYLTPTKNALNYLIYQAYCGKDVTIYNNGQFFRDIIFVTDVVSALQTIMERGKPGNLYWISSYKKTWFYEIAQWLEELTNCKIKYVDPPSYTSKVDVGNFLVDNSKLKSLGWDLKISVKDGIKYTLDYFKQNSL
ncbi:NAD-dependent epimerase/dehydratase family protein [Candidatus Nitrosarchaeum limnium]|uniref:NAD dependent epimerase/dehydratase family protein n=1 Tax=Candidatus Nitrosarchaeum limnium BG20 TaxID=859192 RepID=S2E1P6_9ARCH|nr:GDP-mannose 4,6-dehydratase [Candidatus Nitrosarchaeum limnium]EPA05245.1 NAD dependent epimerase/dehydratase family protein [Candidatus Nitrosarchaeum limnium BG20]